MSRRKNISLRFIAEKCGVSTATVSRVLNNDARVSEETRELVRKV
ncbi:MAG: LacI family DNA-binding transcriptional regulator, partial [Eubacterium sp.]|nr:LacI family DNA-binding transcriptional regulator [Eubacterium sp.]